MPYEWKTDRNGNRRFVRTAGNTRVERISEATPAEMAIDPPTPAVIAPVVEPVETAPVVVPDAPKPDPKPRGTGKGAIVRRRK